MSQSKRQSCRGYHHPSDVINLTIGIVPSAVHLRFHHRLLHKLFKTPAPCFITSPTIYSSPLRRNATTLGVSRKGVGWGWGALTHVSNITSSCEGTSCLIMVLLLSPRFLLYWVCRFLQQFWHASAYINNRTETSS